MINVNVHCHHCLVETENVEFNDAKGEKKLECPNCKAELQFEIATSHYSFNMRILKEVE